MLTLHGVGEVAGGAECPPPGLRAQRGRRPRQQHGAELRGGRGDLGHGEGRIRLQGNLGEARRGPEIM